MAINITSTQRTLYTMRNEEKSDDELQRYTLEIAQKIQSIPPNASPQLLAQAEELLAEAAVCKEILDQRKNTKNRLEQAHKEWEEKLPERRYAAVRNLKEAVSPNGQLVVAILEDEGSLSKQEISTWCAELAALDSSELNSLLSALVEEGVLNLQNGKYAVKRVCTESLFPENPYKWALQQIDDDELDAEEQEVILRLIANKGSAICADDFPAILKDAAFLTAVRDMYPQAIRREKAEKLRTRFQEVVICDMALDDLKFQGILSETVINGYRFFYFPMLGEKEG